MAVFKNGQSLVLFYHGFYFHGIDFTKEYAFRNYEEYKYNQTFHEEFL